MRNSKILRSVALAALATTGGLAMVESAHAQATTSWSGSPRWSEEDRQFKVTGRIQYDLYNVQADFPGTSQDEDYTRTATRRVFLGVAGRYTNAFRYDIKVAFNPGNQQVTLDDAFLEYVHNDFSVIVGQNNAVSPMEDRTSSVNIPFNERSAYMNSFGFAKKMGVAVVTNGGNWSAGVAVHAGDLNQSDTINRDEETSVIGRATWAPFYQNTPEGMRLLHVGATARVRDSGGAPPTGAGANAQNDFSYGARPQNGFGTSFVSATGFDKDVFYGVETAGQWNQFGFNAEYGRLSAQPSSAATGAALARGREDRDFSGGYVDLFWSPTGESRVYKAVDGSFDRIRIRRTLGSDGGIGHVMLGARYEYVDLTDGPTPATTTVGGKQQSYVGQVTWMPISYVKFQLDYSQHNITRTATAAQGDAEVITFRTQLDW